MNMRVAACIGVKPWLSVLALPLALGACAADPAVEQAPDYPDEVIISDGLVFPESLTTLSNGDLVFGSSASSIIYRAQGPAGEATAWFDGSPARLGRVLGVLADEARNVLWVCSTSQADVDADRDLTGIAAFSLDDGAVVGTYPFADGKGLCNDIALDAQGTIYATDMGEGRIFRLTGLSDKAMQVWAHDPLLAGADGIAITSDGTVYVNGIFSGLLLRMDPSPDGGLAAPVQLALSRELGLPDGMRALADGSLLVAEQAGRLSRVVIDGDKGQVDTLADGFVESAAVTVRGDRAYVLQSRLSYGRDPALKGVDPGPARAVAVPLDGL